MVDKDLGLVTAYAYAVSKGYTGTEEEFAALMADYAAVGQRAEAAATAAAASATAASGSASDSAASATLSEGFAGSASTSAGTASQAAQNASQSATAASGSATAAAGSATAAAGSATTAENKATEAAQSATGAAASATTAESAKTAAQTAQTAAETAQTVAEAAQAAAEAAAQTLVIDPTLTQPNQAAEAKATGDAISLVKSHLEATYITDSASGAVASFPDGADGIPVEGLTVGIEPIQSGTGDPSPENVRPISGSTEVNVYQSAVNHIITTAATSSFDVHVIRGYPSSGASHMTKVYTKLEPGTYTLSYMAKLGNNFFPRAYVTFTDGTYATITDMYFDDNTEATAAGLSADSFRRVHRTFTIEKPCNYIRLGNYASNAYAYYDFNYAYRGFKIEKGGLSDADGSETVYTIQLGDTIYGGSLDVTTGVLTMGKVMYEYDGSEDEGWAYGSNSFYINNPQKKAQTPISNRLLGQSPRSYGDISNNCFAMTTGAANYINFRKDDITSLADWKTWLAANPVQMLMEMVAPLTVQLTAQQISTLLGQNNIWSDAGDVVVDYVADTKLFIEQLTEPDADMVADANITSGQYFMVGNSLYLATANIANGAAIIPGTNCTQTNLAEALNAINA